MDALEFILILAVFAVVLHWYLKNERAKSDGVSGLLALKADPETAQRAGRKSYRIKTRTRDVKTRLRDSRVEDAAKTYRTDEESDSRRRRYRRRDGARYRVKDIAST